MTEQDIRELEIRIAKALGFTVEKGTLYAPPPNKTLMGGVYLVHIGREPETPGIIEQVWHGYAPRFARSMDDAMWLLKTLWERHSIQYNLFLNSSNGAHICEIGFWGSFMKPIDHEVWSACEGDPALAIALAVSKCPAVMGDHAGIED